MYVETFDVLSKLGRDKLYEKLTNFIKNVTQQYTRILKYTYEEVSYTIHVNCVEIINVPNLFLLATAIDYLNNDGRNRLDGYDYGRNLLEAKLPKSQRDLLSAKV